MEVLEKSPSVNGGLYQDNEEKSRECIFERSDSGKGKSLSADVNEEDNLQNEQVPRRSTGDSDLDSGIEKTPKTGCFPFPRRSRDDHPDLADTDDHSKSRLPESVDLQNGADSHGQAETSLKDGHVIKTCTERSAKVNIECEKTDPKLDGYDFRGSIAAFVSEHDSQKQSLSSATSSTGTCRSGAKMMRQNSVDLLDPHSIENDASLSHYLRESDHCGAAAVSVQSTESSWECGHQGNDILANAGKNNQVLQTSCHRELSQRVPQNGFCASSNASSAKTALPNSFSQHVSASSSHRMLTPGHPSAVTAVPLSVQNLVPKNVMDSLSRELVREKLKVDQLMEELHKNNEILTHLRSEAGNWKQKSCQVQNDIHLLVGQANLWKQKFGDKEKELNVKDRELQGLREQKEALVHELQETNFLLNQKSQERRNLESINTNLEKCLQAERARFERDLDAHMEKIVLLEEENQGLRLDIASLKDENNYLGWRLEEPETNEPSSDDLNVQMNEQIVSSSAQSSSVDLQRDSGQTEPKRVCSDSTVTNSQTCPKSKLEENLSLREEKCSNCYRSCSSFLSYKDFCIHKEKCT